MQVSSEGKLAGEQIGEAWLRHDGLPQRFDQLAQQSPEARPGQAAQAQRGEASSASIDGSSRSSINKWARI